jgi:hypothetical protein
MRAVLILPLLAAFTAPALAQAPQQRRPPGPPPVPLIACPPSVEVEPAERLRAPLGWEVRPERQRHWLRGADLFEGNPADRVQVIPAGERSNLSPAGMARGAGGAAARRTKS